MKEAAWGGPVPGVPVVLEVLWENLHAYRKQHDWYVTGMNIASSIYLRLRASALESGGRWKETCTGEGTHG